MFRTVDIVTEKGLRDACLIILAAFGGLRVGEISKLRTGDIIQEGEDIDIAIPEDIGKKHQSRTVFLWKSPSRLLLRFLSIRMSQGAKPEDPFLVSYRHGRPTRRALGSSDIDHIVKITAQKAGVHKTRVTPHMFRATHANDLQRIRGYALPSIQERMGWKGLSTAGKYLVRRERLHKIYRNLHEYWIEFNSLWRIE
jgi:integrase